ncbi:hypothetical protein E2C01_062676 [Portunus trituberculatus]|uniref:Uncharacterized protein n=1 Tax=Portunus trituberculatus TaxID=210409 RepID=A0A5B7HIP8_PORTR|nr:hypothetical protein [Portunus trituberculatus]
METVIILGNISIVPHQVPSTGRGKTPEAPHLSFSLRVASLSEDIDRDGGGEDNNMLTDFLRDFQEKMVKQVHNRSLQKDGEIPL